MIIEPASSSIVHRPPKKAGQEDEAFSLAMASAALEARAGASLKAFSGDGAKKVASPQDAAGETAANAPTSRDSPKSGGSSHKSPETRIRSGSTAVAPSSTGDLSPKASPAIAVSPAPSIAAASLISQPAAPLKADGLSGRDAALTRTRPAVAAPKLDRPAPAAPEAFAQILAKRLQEGGSEFDLRLDPPELGKVHARLHVGEDGKAVLALSFDSQSTLEQFSRDEAALRNALASAGVDISHSDLRFEFNDPRSAALSAAPSDYAGPSVATTPLTERNATVAAAGLIDIRI